MREETTINKTQNEEYRLACGKCRRETRHRVLQSVDVEGDDRKFDFQFVDNYQIIQCQGCDFISFRKSHSNSWEFIYEEDNEEPNYVSTVELYPRVARRDKLLHAYILPTPVKCIYDETHSALSNKQPILAGVGIRTLVEAVCNEKAAAGRRLVNKIDDLVKKGVLTQAGAETLHSLRILGNDAVHQVKPHSEKTLNLALDVVEHLLNDVYVLPATTKDLPKPKTPSRKT